MLREARPSRTTLLTLWESRTDTVLQKVGLDSVRTTILTLAVLASLIPVLAVGIMQYRQNRRAIQDKLTEQLSGLSAQAAREMDLWLKEDIYNLRVFAASYEVSENVARGPQTRGRLPDYLRSVRERFADYDELLVVSRDGRTIASSERGPGRLHFSGDWQAPARSGDAVIGEPFVADSNGDKAIELAVPVIGTTGRFLGVLAARVNFLGARTLLVALGVGHNGNLALLERDGHVITATSAGSSGVPAPALHRLLQDSLPVTFDDAGRTGMVGMLAPIHRTGWNALADVPQSRAFAQIRSLRNATILLVLVLLVAVGSLAYGLGLLIVQPIERLSGAARRVAGGDLDVMVPVLGTGELAQLTGMFNDMVGKLRDSRAELERLSLTDHLTGLMNRRGLMLELEREARRSSRLERRFVVAMLDVDHFKKFNDSWGHPAGDELLRRLAKVMLELVREVDTAARYGGEEFLVILAETPAAEAELVAERLRERVEAERFTPQSGQGSVGVTISIGLAEFPSDGTTSESLIAAADQALYKAKEAGRNRVVSAGAFRPAARKTGTRKP